MRVSAPVPKSKPVAQTTTSSSRNPALVSIPFAVIRKIGRNGSEITFPGAISPGIPAAYGWLRASHRKLDPTRSTPYRPYHTHDELLKLDPGAVVPLEIEIWPTSIVFEPGDRLVLEVAAEDDPRMAPFLHDHALDRVRRGTFTLYSGGAHDSQLLMPLIPQR